MIITNFDFELFEKKAREKASEMLNNGLYSRFGLNAGERFSKAFLGCLGELAFAHWLDQKSVKYEIDTLGFDNRNSDEFDFLINGKKIDVKVALKSTSNPPNDNWTYGYPQEQKPQNKDFVVIGWIDKIRKEIGFYGWLSGHQICKSPIVLKNSFKGYSYKTPNHEFRWGLMIKDFERLLSILR